MHELRIGTPSREAMVDITGQVREVIVENRWNNGMVTIFCPHTTAAVTINEAADPTVARDILTALLSLVPRQGDYRHVEGNSDAHIKASLIGADARVPVQAGKMLLGTWQGLFFMEFDGPRSRKIWLQWFASESKE